MEPGSGGDERMDIATLVGLVIGVGVIALAVAEGSDFLVFLNLPGFLIVFGGVFASTLIKFPISTLGSALWDGIKVAFIARRVDPQQLIRMAGEMATIVRKNGILALDSYPIKNTFLQKGVTMCVDGAAPDHIHQVLTRDMTQSIQREEVSERVFRAIGEAGPAFGLIGTLIGLVQMLIQMNDPTKIGPAMAIALLTTLYGALIANLVAIPIADKLETKALQDRTNRELIIDTVLGIQRGENPRVLVELLEAYIKDDRRQTEDDRRDDGVDRRKRAVPVEVATATRRPGGAPPAQAASEPRRSPVK